MGEFLREAPPEPNSWKAVKEHVNNFRNGTYEVVSAITSGTPTKRLPIRRGTAQMNEAKGLEGGCTARLFVSVVRVTVAEVMFRSK